jgi:ribosome-binding protein aMBF1 (putative translation factor)
VAVLEVTRPTWSYEVIADQLGNTVAVVKRHYRQKYQANTVTAAALESMMSAQDEPDTG